MCGAVAPAPIGSGGVGLLSVLHTSPPPDSRKRESGFIFVAKIVKKMQKAANVNSATRMRLNRLQHLFKQKPRSRKAEESDFGRRFGWFIEKDGAKIGELGYLRWDSIAQYWHEYRIIWYSPENAVTGPDAWISAKLVLRNRHYTDVVVESFLTGVEREGGVVPVRGAFVSEERIRKDDEANQP